MVNLSKSAQNQEKRTLSKIRKTKNLASAVSSLPILRGLETMPKSRAIKVRMYPTNLKARTL